MTQHVLGVAGTRQVDLDGRVDRNDVVVLCDYPRVVEVVHRPALHGRVAVEEIVHELIAHGEGEHAFADVDRLAPVGHCARID